MRRSVERLRLLQLSNLRLLCFSIGHCAKPTFDPMRIARDPLHVPFKLESDPTRIAHDLLRFPLQHV